jgi:uncharacterized protein (DUF427 family)
MTNIAIQTKAGQKIVAGVVGENIILLEGYYYFNKEDVNFDLLTMKNDMYTCPIKNSTCDYYYLKNKNNQPLINEIAWAYNHINNNLYKSIEGKIGFYAKSNDYVDLVQS